MEPIPGGVTVQQGNVRGPLHWRPSGGGAGLGRLRHGRVQTWRQRSPKLLRMRQPVVGHATAIPVPSPGRPVAAARRARCLASGLTLSTLDIHGRIERVRLTWRERQRAPDHDVKSGSGTTGHGSLLKGWSRGFGAGHVANGSKLPLLDAPPRTTRPTGFLPEP